jgi:PIN domain nuclease of toxin-antitoxin system
VGRSTLIVLDTHVWLWLVAAPKQLSRRARLEIERASAIGVSALSCWEVGMLAARGRITLDRDIATWIASALGREGLRPLEVTPEIAVAAALLDESFPPDPADRLIYATARRHGAPLVTRDRRLRDADPAATLW